MTTMSTLSLVAFVIYLFPGIYIIITDRKSAVNRLFFLMSLALALWAFGAMFAFSTTDKNTFILWFRIASVGSLAYFVLSLHFCIVLTGIIRPKWYVTLLYLPYLVFLYRNLTALYFYKDFIWDGTQWIFITAYDTWTYLYLCYNTGYTLLSIALLIIWRFKARTNRERKQSVTLFSILGTALAIGTIEAVILPLFSSHKSSGFSPVIIALWMCGIFYTIVKYRFLAMTPELVSREILAGIDESIILLNPELRIIYVNDMTTGLLKRSEQELHSYNLSKVIFEHETLSKEIGKIMNSEYPDFACRLHYIIKEDEHLLMDARFSIVKDRFNDMVGILIVGREVRETKQLKAIYKFTDRQAEIIQQIIMGFSNRDIGLSLNISERTVKGHISAIFNKLDVTNRMEMLNLLKSFDLVPEHTAEKSVILLNSN